MAGTRGCRPLEGSRSHMPGPRKTAPWNSKINVCPSIGHIPRQCAPCFFGDGAVGDRV